MLETLIDQVIVIDTPYSLQYIGTLVKFNEEFVELKDVDVHDASETKTTKEQYIMESCRDFVKKNRNAVMIKQNCIVSISRLSDILVY